MRAQWTDDHAFELDGVTYSPMHEGEAELVLLKTPEMVAFYEDLVESEQPSTKLWREGLSVVEDWFWDHVNADWGWKEAPSGVSAMPLSRLV